MMNHPVDPVSVVQRQLGAYNVRNLEVLLATYANDAQLLEHPSTLLASGLTQLHERFSASFQEPNVHAQLLRCIVMGCSVINNEVVTRTVPAGAGTVELVASCEVHEGTIAKKSFISGRKALHQKSWVGTFRLPGASRFSLRRRLI